MNYLLPTVTLLSNLVLAGCFPRPAPRPAAKTSSVVAGHVELIVPDFATVKLKGKAISPSGHALPEFFDRSSTGVPKHIVNKYDYVGHIRGTKCYLVIGSSRGGKTMAGVIYDFKWKLIGNIKGMPKSVMPSLALWNDTGEKCLLIFADDARPSQTFAGVLDVKRLKYYSMLKRKTTGDFSAAIWLKERAFACVLASSTEGTRNEIWELNAVSNKARNIYSDRYLPGQRDIWTMQRSPNGKYIAFDRVNYSSMSDESSGIWLLNTATGKCQQITFQSNKVYAHRIVYWVSDSEFVFESEAGLATVNLKGSF